MFAIFPTMPSHEVPKSNFNFSTPYFAFSTQCNWISALANMKMRSFNSSRPKLSLIFSHTILGLISLAELNIWNNTELCHLKGPKKDQTLSEIIDMLRRSKKSNRCFPPRRETSVHPTAWTLIGRQALWGAIMSQFLYQKEKTWENQIDRP